jgi:2-oxoglutarate dehydrogenase E1 component
VLPETEKLVARTKVKRVVLCSGKVYYDLLAAREEMNIGNVALVRMEQLYPFPNVSLSKELHKYPNAEVVWCQEEPKNMGAWTYLDRRLEDLLGNVDIKADRPIYVGRPEAASPATGSFDKHMAEQQAFVTEALTT